MSIEFQDPENLLTLKEAAARQELIESLKRELDETYMELDALAAARRKGLRALSPQERAAELSARSAARKAAWERNDRAYNELLRLEQQGAYTGKRAVA